MQKGAMEHFAVYLENTAGIPSRYVPHFLRWVTLYKRSNKPKPANRESSLQVFQNQLERTQEPWKANQALEAVRYYWYWQDRQNTRGSSAGKIDLGREELLSEFRRLLRLQHKSYRTE